MKWLKLDCSFFDHPKTLRLADELGIDCAGFYVLQLLAYLGRHDHDGLFESEKRVTRDDLATHFSTRAIARAAGWKGEPVEFVRAMVAAGFLILEEYGLRVCNWLERNEKHREVKRQAAIRQQRRRDRLRAEREAENVTRDSRERHAGEGDPGSGLEKEKGDGSVIHRAELFTSSPVQASFGRAPEIEGRVQAKPRLAAKRSITRDALGDAAELAAGLMTGMGKCEPPSRVTQVSPSFALGYWRGQRSAPVLANLGEDDTDDPLGVLERLEQREGLTGTTLEAMRVFLHERTRATDKKRLCTFASEGVFQQRMREARRRLDAVVAG